VLFHVSTAGIIMFIFTYWISSFFPHKHSASNYWVHYVWVKLIFVIHSLNFVWYKASMSKVYVLVVRFFFFQIEFIKPTSSSKLSVSLKHFFVQSDDCFRNNLNIQFTVAMGIRNMCLNAIYSRGWIWKSSNCFLNQ